MTPERFQEISSAKDKSPYLEEMVGMLMDVNWPYASECIEILKQYEDDIVPHIKNVLVSNDEEWVYFTITHLLDTWKPKNILLIEPNLKNHVEQIDFQSQVDLYAIELIVKHNATSFSEMKSLLLEKKDAANEKLSSYSDEEKEELISLEKNKIELLQSGQHQELMMKFISNPALNEKLSEFTNFYYYEKFVEELLKVIDA